MTVMRRMAVGNAKAENISRLKFKLEGENFIMITEIPNNDDNMSLFELMTFFGRDRTVNSAYREGRFPQNDQLCESINKVVDLLAVDKSSKEEHHDKIMCLLGDSWDKTYQLGFADGMRFIMQAMNA